MQDAGGDAGSDTGSAQGKDQDKGLDLAGLVGSLTAGLGRRLLGFGMSFTGDNGQLPQLTPEAGSVVNNRSTGTLSVSNGPGFGQNATVP